MHGQIVLTPAESKRLIARGVVASATVQAALHAGIVAVAKGTTNSYVVEEFLGKAIDKQRYVTGLRLPAKNDRSWIPKVASMMLCLSREHPSTGRLLRRSLRT